MSWPEPKRIGTRADAVREGQIRRAWMPPQRPAGTPITVLDLLRHCRVGLQGAGIGAAALRCRLEHDRRPASPGSDRDRSPRPVARADGQLETDDERAVSRRRRPPEEHALRGEHGHADSLQGHEPRSLENERCLVQHLQGRLRRFGPSRLRDQDEERGRAPPTSCLEYAPSRGAAGSLRTKTLTLARSCRGRARDIETSCADITQHCLEMA